MIKINTQPFDVKTVSLEGKNLIEASAGTGKTFSIAVLLVRMVLETDIKLKELLLVTFTDSAVEELSERARTFLKTAYKIVSQGFEVDKSEGVLEEILFSALEKQGKEAIYTKLKNALLLLDEIQISTIHGFCNNTLKQFAFETQQLFESELIKDEKPLFEKVVNEFWRKNITQLPEQELKFLFDQGFSRSELIGSLENSTSGFVFLQPEQKRTYTIQEIVVLESEYQKKVLFLTNFIQENKETYKSLLIKNLTFFKQIDFPGQATVELITAFNKNLLFVQKLPSSLIHLVEEVVLLNEDVSQAKLQIKVQKHSQCIDFANKYLKQLKSQKSLQTYNDMILNVHKAIMGDQKEAIILQLKKRYKAVFIDEFQDTDKVQYEIFYEAFGNKAFDTLEGVYPTKVFYIGDPKQSIYAFRQANLITYNQARLSSVNYGMDTNFRSVPKFVDAMNEFFEPRASFGFFKDDKIAYTQVKAADKWTNQNEFLLKGLDTKSFTFIESQKERKESIAQEVLHILKFGTIDGENIKPSDIGILTKYNNTNTEIKLELSKLGIPAVVLDETKVLKSHENLVVRYVLLLILNKDRSSLNKLMLTNFTQYNEHDLEHLDFAAEILRFSSVVVDFEKFGIYPALMTFLKLYGSKSALEASMPHLAARSMSNFIQLAEICNQRQLRFNEDLAGLITWLNKQNDTENEDGEYIQRLESDQDAVNIVTIHKSKGLQYKLVLIYANKSKSRGDSNKFLDFQDEAGSYKYVFNSKESAFKEQKKIQDAQEEMRLWYVAITRAVYKCYIFWTNVSSNPTTFQEHRNQLLLSPFYDAHFEDTEPRMEVGERYQKTKEVFVQNHPVIDFTIDFKALWSVSSYSSISHATHTSSEKIRLDHLEGYNEFVFHQMPRGTIFGSFMHQIFEEINFNAKESLPKYLLNKLKSPFSKGILTDKNLENYQKFIEHVLFASLTNADGASFTLAQIEQKLPELEFYFSVDTLRESDLKLNFEQYVSFQNNEYKGFVNGFIDLCFQHQGKFYILDWKSNHLGDDLSLYQQEYLLQAMDEQNYHLQYFIYTIALCRQLKLIDPAFDYNTQFGGVFYLFVRGCRKGTDSGVFYYKPTLESIEQYF